MDVTHRYTFLWNKSEVPKPQPVGQMWPMGNQTPFSLQVSAVILQRQGEFFKGSKGSCSPTSGGRSKGQGSCMQLCVKVFMNSLKINSSPCMRKLFMN